MDSLTIFSHPDDSAFAALPKAAARLSLSIVRSARYMSDELAAKLASMLSADTLWTLCLILAAWAIATIIGGPIAVAVDGFLILYGLYSLYEQLSATWSGLAAWAKSAYDATDDDSLEKAARLFAKAAAEGSLDLLAVILTHKVFVKAQTTLRKRFPTPRWLKDEVVSAEAERSNRKNKGDKPGRQETPKSGDGEEAPPARRIQDPVDRALNLARGAGAGDLAQGGSVLTSLLVGGVVVIGIGAVAAVAATGGKNGKKRG